MKWGRDLSPVFKEMRRPFTRDQADHRKRQEGPEGKWPARSPFTLERAKRRAMSKGKKRAGKVLGKLPGAYKLSVSPFSIRADSLVKWSGVHWRGAGRTGRSPGIPARDFFWVSAKLINEMVAIIVKSARRQW